VQKPQLELEYLLGPGQTGASFPPKKRCSGRENLQLIEVGSQRVVSIGLGMFFALTPTTIAAGSLDWP
jgi:hypothetical protein